ncbi:phosphoenolpyruvate--protein phosphotransferase [Agromyces archimandritae]|uniref:Phosphoenolpyruvate-protein phosphotransferase n=1 Tax=Agromyces archimandritae TaxID=2781962 RepID=A0A975FP07_9MICO|nr:phosphoenolpyruvate--protein phosphotransferase [Agromyces archimandritae]QTX05471.1 phosphoenolpyruvate--protein phosphotransferase [Agromyces archimandritae]
MRITGTGIGRGIAVGPVARMNEALPEPPDDPSKLGEDAERKRATAALDAVSAELKARGDAAGGSAKDVLEAQSMMAADPSLVEELDTRLAAGKTAERGVWEAFASFRDVLAGMGGYLGERAADLDDIAQRVVARLRGVPAPGIPDPGHPFVLVAHDLAPADTALLDLDRVVALVTAEGGPTSHTAILAREKSLVAVVGATGADGLEDGVQVIVDAAAGAVTVDPDGDALAEAARRGEELRAEAGAPLRPGALADGTAVPLLANLGSPDGAAEAVRQGAEGVGLFRTEFLFLDAAEAPSVEAQQAEYRRLFQAFPGERVVVRVLDAGADKPLAFLNHDEEPNPALGRRGIRALFAAPEVLADQLGAIAGAAKETDACVEVMAPMVATADEARRFVEAARKAGLSSAGVMVEVPAAALLAGHVLDAADFASIGTNDLTQYTMAADRLLGGVAELQDPWDPAVLELVRSVGDAGRTRGKHVGICGEAAADPLLAVVLVGLGATSLSMSPAALADVRASLARFRAEDARTLAEAALAAEDGATARAAASKAAEGVRGASTGA